MDTLTLRRFCDIYRRVMIVTMEINQVSLLLHHQVSCLQVWEVTLLHILRFPIACLSLCADTHPCFAMSTGFLIVFFYPFSTHLFSCDNMSQFVSYHNVVKKITSISDVCNKFSLCPSLIQSTYITHFGCSRNFQHSS